MVSEGRPQVSQGRPHPLRHCFKVFRSDSAKVKVKLLFGFWFWLRSVAALGLRSGRTLKGLTRRWSTKAGLCRGAFTGYRPCRQPLQHSMTRWPDSMIRCWLAGLGWVPGIGSRSGLPVANMCLHLHGYVSGRNNTPDPPGSRRQIQIRDRTVQKIFLQCSKN